ncbi:hypothetical protein GCM10011613_31980 [Cellvibrio zantedeschiae]|uniref:DUF4405 domain-containing protein n=1 Tax=Cellvibrio zantedeschiae TaxID=1237077 RepID=A0ABQ3BBI1_9GAMM|nr:DUF4405 domain-containing protein [Cellvibrio zantedeschiae]GGY84607.1 hypothetical protein GCM10011613_31980 [Cellvibrio zantedeschiae]
MAKSFNRRAFVSLLVFLFFTVILVTSLLMFISPHTPMVSMVHTGIGFVLLLILGWHLKNNLSSLKTYFTFRTAKSGTNLAMPVALALSMTMLGLGLMQSLPFASLYAWGNKLRSAEKSAEQLQFSYVRVDQTNASALGNKLVIDLRKGPYFRFPQYAIWLETLEGKFIQPLYITQKLAQNKFTNKVTLRDQKQIFTSDVSGFDDQTWDKTFASELSPETASKRTRPESLPVFLHQLASQKLTDNQNNPASTMDAYAGATLLNNFLMSSRSNNDLPEKYKIRFEINQSFDFNTFYSSDRFPDDPIYSGDGYNGQPSVIYEAIIDTQSSQQYYPMTLIGHGHHSGKDGKVHTDMNNLTTAKELVDRIIIEVKSD